MKKHPKHQGFGLFRLARGAEGATAIEFALIAPVVLLFVLGIFEFSLVMFVTAVLESASGNTSRLGKTGYVAAGLTRQQQITSSIQAQTIGLLNPALLTITTTVYPNIQSVNQPEPCLTSLCGGGVKGTDYIDINGNNGWDADMGVAGLGNAGDIVVYTISYPWPIWTPLVRAVIGNTVTIRTRTVIKNEPF